MYNYVQFCLHSCLHCPIISKTFSFAVLAGTVITTIPRGGSLHATVSIINIYKEGNLAIQQAGKNMSAKVVVVCKQCPLLRRGESEKNLSLSSRGAQEQRRGRESLSEKIMDLSMPWLV